LRWFATVQALTVTGCASLLGWLAVWSAAAEVAVSYHQCFCRWVEFANNLQAAAHAEL
jgi:hypothetical protein